MFFNQLKEQESQTPAMWHQLLNLGKLIAWLSVGAGPLLPGGQRALRPSI